MSQGKYKKYSFYIRKTLKIISTVLFTAFVCALFVLCLAYREQITADQITKLTPKNQLAAVIFMLLVFALKSLCVFIYCGILYAACGMVFPIQLAVLVNILGTVVMTSVPYLIGRNAGSRHIEKMLKKHPKMSVLKKAQDKNSFFLSFMVRITGLLPSDLVSAYFGASGITYGKYILSTVLGFLPMIIAFSFMGMSAHDITSPAFIISAGLNLVIMILSTVIYILILKKGKKGKEKDISAKTI